MAEAEFSLWTAFLDYYATGEGRTAMARICYSPDEAGVRRQFGEAFAPYYAQNCTVERGLVRNGITTFLWSIQALNYFESLNPHGAVEANSVFRFSLS